MFTPPPQRHSTQTPHRLKATHRLDPPLSRPSPSAAAACFTRDQEPHQFWWLSFQVLLNSSSVNKLICFKLWQVHVVRTPGPANWKLYFTGYTCSGLLDTLRRKTDLAEAVSSPDERRVNHFRTQPWQTAYSLAFQDRLFSKP